MAEPLPYRRGVGVMLVNRDGLIFVGKRIDMPSDHWQMPQGGIDEGEDPRATAVRELEEEIGTAKAEFIAETPGWLRYDLPPDLIGRIWKGRYRGQEQKWYAMRFLGTDADIDLATAHPEFLAWKWAPLEQLCDLIVPFKRGLYRDVIAALGPSVRAS